MLEAEISSGAQSASWANAALGFTPKCCLAFINQCTGDTSTANSQSSIGASDFAGTDRSASYMSTHNVSPSTCGVLVGAGAALRTVDNAGASLGSCAPGLTGTAPGGSFSADDGRARLFSLLCLGGIDLSGVVMGVLDFPSSLGVFDTTWTWPDGSSDKPDVVLIFASQAGINTDPASSGAVHVNECLGWCCADGTQGVVATTETDAVATSAADRYQRTSSCLAAIDGTPVILMEAAWDSMLPAGVRLNATTVTNQRKFCYVALKGINASAYSFNMGAATGEITASLPFTPKCHLLQSQCLAATTAITTQAIHATGIAVSSNSRAHRATTGRNNVNPTQSTSWQNRAACLQTYSLVAGGIGSRDYLDFVSNGANAVTFNCTVAVGVARQVLGLALGSRCTKILDGGILDGGIL